MDAVDQPVVLAACHNVVMAGADVHQTEWGVERQSINHACHAPIVELAVPELQPA